jgi:hypothetical protein
MRVGNLEIPMTPEMMTDAKNAAEAGNIYLALAQGHVTRVMLGVEIELPEEIKEEYAKKGVKVPEGFAINAPASPDKSQQNSIDALTAFCLLFKMLAEQDVREAAIQLAQEQQESVILKATHLPKPGH